MDERLLLELRGIRHATTLPGRPCVVATRRPRRYGARVADLVDPDLGAAADATATYERRGNLDVLPLAQLSCLGADVVVTTRAGGVSAAPYDTLNLGDRVGDDPDAVGENRCRLAEAMGVEPADLVIARQVHGTGVAVVAHGDVVGDADVLVTTDPSIAICVLVADCVPVALLDPVARVLAVAHAGWRGVASNVVGAALDAMAREGADPARCRAALGPCISQKSYQVGGEVVAALREAGCDSAVAPDRTGRHLADLAGAVRSQLVAGGVPAGNVDLPTSWTDRGATFFSDRAQRPCGRFALAARLRDAAS
jgi:polyphenol oxidase